MGPSQCLDPSKSGELHRYDPKLDNQHVPPNCVGPVIAGLAGFAERGRDEPSLTGEITTMSCDLTVEEARDALDERVRAIPVIG